MYAIVEIAGQQFKVEEGRKIFVHRLENEEGSLVNFDKVLLVENGENIMVGEPAVTDFIVEGKVLDHVRGDKVIVFKKKRKKGYRVRNGHRQNFTQIEITGIGSMETLSKREPKKEPVKKAAKAVVAEPVVEEPVKEKKTTPRKTTAKKATEAKEEKSEAEPKKPAAKKPAAKKSPKAKEE